MGSFEEGSCHHDIHQTANCVHSTKKGKHPKVRIFLVTVQ